MAHASSTTEDPYAAWSSSSDLDKFIVAKKKGERPPGPPVAYLRSSSLSACIISWIGKRAYRGHQARGSRGEHGVRHCGRPWNHWLRAAGKDPPLPPQPHRWHDS